MVSGDSSVEVRPEYFLSASLEIAQNLHVTRRFDIRGLMTGHNSDTPVCAKSSEAFRLYYASVDIYFPVKPRGLICVSHP